MVYANNDVFCLYGMRLRGYSPGAQPKGVFRRMDDPTGKYHDIIVYPMKYKLSKRAVFQYDLDYLGTKTWAELSV